MYANAGYVTTQPTIILSLTLLISGHMTDIHTYKVKQYKYTPIRGGSIINDVIPNP